jgi:hypothetical protein
MKPVEESALESFPEYFQTEMMHALTTAFANT